MKKKLSLSLKILIGLFLGILAGLCLQDVPDIANNYIKPFGTLFINLIKMVIVPLVFSSLVMGACGLGNIRKIGRIGGKTIAYFLLTTACAATIGISIGLFLNVGSGISIPSDITTVEIKESPNIIDTLLDIIPVNPFNALAQGNMLQVIFFALFIGGGIAIVGEKATVFKEVINGLAEIMYTIVGGVIKLAPFAVFALMTPVIATNGPKVLLPLLSLLIAVYLACILHAVIVYSTTVKLLGKTNPIDFFIAAIPAIIFAFTTSSSSATVPITLESSKKLGVPDSIRSFIIPLGATVNMDGTAAGQTICVLFIANIYGINLGLSQLITIGVYAILASIGAAGVPGIGVVVLGMILQSVGLPVEGVAIIMGVDRISEMIRTSVNVAGDIACSVVVAASEKELHTKELNTNDTIFEDSA